MSAIQYPVAYIGLMPQTIPTVTKIAGSGCNIYVTKLVYSIFLDRRYQCERR